MNRLSASDILLSCESNWYIYIYIYCQIKSSNFVQLHISLEYIYLIYIQSFFIPKCYDNN